MSEKRKAALVAGIPIIILIALVSGMFLLLYDAYQEEPVCPVPDVVRVYTPSEAMVEISVYQDGQRSYGHGTVIRHDDQIFVLTSSMIFTEDRDSISIDQNEHSFGAEILYQNSDWGLVALDCPLIEMIIPFVELNDDPNIPPFVPVGINGWPASTLGYINDDWVLLSDLPEEDCTGMPVSQNDALIGVVVGLNRINREQAIMIGNRALNEFCDQVTSVLDAPAVYTPKGPT